MPAAIFVGPNSSPVHDRLPMAGMKSKAVPMDGSPRARRFKASESEVNGHSCLRRVLLTSYSALEKTFISVNQDLGTLLADATVSQIYAKRAIGLFVAPQHALFSQANKQFFAVG
jgi:hypothetical protein